jgi:nitrate/nitrite transport system substrate-binding protein
VLGVTRDWANAYPNTHLALIAALLEAGRWLDEPDHRVEAAVLFAATGVLEAPLGCITQALSSPAPTGDPGLVFFRSAAGFPWRSHGAWFISQLQRWNLIHAPLNPGAAAAAVFRPDLYRIAAAQVGVPAPLQDQRTEGTHSSAWPLATDTGPLDMGPDLFLDGAVYPGF